MNKYVVITWPESQDLCAQPWFDECVLVNDDQGLEKFGVSAYFVPEDRVNEMKYGNISDFIVMVPVQGGTFQFADQITVTVSDFMIGKYPVTQKQWREIMGSNPSYFKGDDLPVESVSWEDAQAFIKKLNERFPGHDFRLPSEAEWEYAARGGLEGRKSNYVYSGSDNLGEVGWYTNNSGDTTKPVGGKKTNQLGLYDMSGNVNEWCEDDWHDDIESIPKDGAPSIDQPERGSSRVARGGSWFSIAEYCRATKRNSAAPTYRGDNAGFRLVCNI